MKDIFLLDADNTVLDFNGSSKDSLEYAFSRYSYEWKEEYITYFTKLNNYLWSQLERKEITREYLLGERFKMYLDHFGIKDIPPDDFNLLYHDFLKHNPKYVEGAFEFVKELKKHGKIYIVTNGNAENQYLRFSISKLDTLIDGCFISEVIGYNKPHVKYSEAVMNGINEFSKERAIWIGDSLSADIKGANAVGLDSIWFNPENLPEDDNIKPTFIAKSFEEIKNILGIN